MPRWSDEQFDVYRLLKKTVDEGKPIEPHARAKYRNKRMEINGEKFDSIAEGKRFVELRRMQEAGDSESTAPGFV